MDKSRIAITGIDRSKLEPLDWLLISRLIEQGFKYGNSSLMHEQYDHPYRWDILDPTTKHFATFQEAIENIPMTIEAMAKNERELNEKNKQQLSEYDKLPITVDGKRYIIRSKCCLSIIHYQGFICSGCQKKGCESITFIER